MEIDDKSNRHDEVLRIELLAASPRASASIAKNLILAVDKGELSSVKVENIIKSRNSVDISFLLEALGNGVPILLSIYDLIRRAKSENNIKDALEKFKREINREYSEVLSIMNQTIKEMIKEPPEIHETKVAYGSQEPVSLTRGDFYELGAPEPLSILAASGAKSAPARSRKISRIKSLTNTKSQHQAVINFLVKLGLNSITDLNDEQINELIDLLIQKK